MSGPKLNQNTIFSLEKSLDYKIFGLNFSKSNKIISLYPFIRTVYGLVTAAGDTAPKLAAF